MITHTTIVLGIGTSQTLEGVPYTRKFSRYEIFAEQQVNRIFAIIFSRITAPMFSRFSRVIISTSVATWLQNI